MREFAKKYGNDFKQVSIRTAVVDSCLTKLILYCFIMEDTRKKLQVNCSPRTFGKLNEDREFAQNYSQQIMQETEEVFDEIIFAPIVDIVEGANEATTGSPEGSIWTDAATKFMLSSVKELYGKVGKSSSLKNKTKLWQMIAENLCKEGCRFSPSQVETKFRGLERQYKKAKLNNSQTGRSRMTCMYQSELDEILGVRKGINPDYTFDSESQQPLASTSTAESSQEATDEAPTTSSRARETERGKLLRKFDEITQQKEERHQKLLEFLEKKEFHKIEKEKRREEFQNRIVGLLEKVVNKFTQ